MNTFLESINKERISIVYKLVFTITLLITAGMVSLGSIVLNNQSTVLSHQMEILGTTLAAQVAQSSGELMLAEDRFGLEMIINNTLKHPVVIGITLYSNNQKIFAFSGVQRTLEQADFSYIDSKKQRSNDINSQKGIYSVVEPMQFRDVTVGYIQLNFDRSLMDESRQKSIDDIVWSTLLMILISFSIAFLIGKRLTVPIFEVINASNQIKEGNFDIKFNYKSNDELGELTDSLESMASELNRKEKVENALHKYISPNIASQVLDHLDEIHLGGDPVEATVLFIDIVGFTSLSEGMSPKDITELLNDYFSFTAQAAHLNKGHIDKFIGDCAMMVFGIPSTSEHHAYNAIAASLLLVELFNQLGEIRKAEGKKAVMFRFGLNSGKMVAGNLGAPERMEYTVIGEAVNLASRLGHVGSANEIIVSEELLKIDELGSRVEADYFDKVEIRGVEEPISVYRVTGLTEQSNDAIKKLATQIMADRKHS